MATKRDTKGQFTANGNGQLPVPDMNAMLTGLVNDLVENASYSLSSRARLAKAMGDPRRDVDEECGYTKTEQLSFDEYWQMYERNGIATRVVEVMPDECWSVSPNVYTDENPDTQSPFEQSWDDLGSQLGNTAEGQSWHRQEEGSPIWEYMRRVDILSRIGRYGVLMLGFDDGDELKNPVKPGKGRKLLYLRCFHEGGAAIERWEKDPKSPRRGQPVSYRLNTQGGDQNVTEEVHHTRVLHVAETLLTSEVYARQAQLPVWNRLYDLVKTYGAAGQGYWDAGLPLRSIESHPQSGNIKWPDDLKEQWERVMTGLQRVIAMKQVTLKTHAPGVLSPGPFTEAAIEAICIAIDCPKRIFMGSERGELSSNQDERRWTGRKVPGRQRRYLTPRLVVPFVDRLIWAGVLPDPGEDGYCVDWPKMDRLTPEQQAAVAESRMKAAAAYIQGGVNQMIPEVVFLTKELGYDDDEAREALDQAVAEQQAEEDAPMPEPQPTPAIPPGGQVPPVQAGEGV